MIRRLVPSSAGCFVNQRLVRLYVRQSVRSNGRAKRTGSGSIALSSGGFMSNRVPNFATRDAVNRRKDRQQEKKTTRPFVSCS